MKLTFVTVSAPALRLVPAAVRRVDQLVPDALSLEMFYAVHELSLAETDRMVKSIRTADAVFLDLMGAPPAVTAAVDRGCADCAGQIIPFGASSRQFLRLGEFSSASMRARSGGKKPNMQAMRKMQGMAERLGRVLPGKMRDMRNYSLCMKYFQNATEENIFQMLVLLAGEYGGISGLPKAAPPWEPPQAALYDPASMTAFSSIAALDKALGHDPALPNVVLFFTPYAYPTDTAQCVDALRQTLSDFCNVYPVGTNGFFSDYEKELRRLLFPLHPRLILDCTPFRLAAGPMGGDADAGVRLLEELGAPLLHPFFLTRRTEAQWRELAIGCTPGEVLISLLLPELDGALEMIPVAAMSEPAAGPDPDVPLLELQPIPERLEHFARRVRRHLELGAKPNSQKRVALLCYNYPPGEADLFGGAFLDTFASVAAILERLKQEGYQTDALTADQLMDVFRAGRAVNSGLYDSSWKGQILWPAKRYHSDPEIEAVWGPAPGEIMTEQDSFLIPGCVCGNVFIGLQPARGTDAGDAAAYHSRTLPPHHQYAAFYQWLREEFKADVIVHIGTHGTLEFLKGKESGMSADCWPDRLLGELPHLYLYYCGNPAEAVIARRRSYANLVSYQPPVFEESGLYGSWLELSTALDNYRGLLATAPDSARTARDVLREKALALGLPDDPEEIEAELDRMAHSLIPHGLHVFGSQYTAEELEQYAHGIAVLRAGGSAPDEQTLAQARLDAAPAARSREMDSLMDALSDRYIPPRLAGDIYRNPDVLPSGYNLYQFDPRLIPSEGAMRRGWEIAENTLSAWKSTHDSWPRSTALIAWGLEASRTQGETIGQALAFLGVRLADDNRLWEHKFQIIPLEELHRPRIDVTLNICGFFRDMFGDLIEALDDLFQQLAALDEPEDMNYFKAHTRRRFEALCQQGIEESEARQLAAARIFGPPEGEYGTGLTDIVQSRQWQEESELGTAFTDSLHYVYSRRMSGRDVKGLYEDNLSCVEVISQLRSNTEYELTDLDHYYEFFGGLAKSVELVRGRKSAMYITDTTGGSIRTETAERSIARGLNTRMLNPRWIDGMLAHKYHGAQKIKDRFENVMGLAATTGAVAPHFYDDLEARYVKDEDVRRRMIENNPHAYRAILEQMLEYSGRGYWDASPEQLAEIQTVYLRLEGDLEEMIEE